MLCYWRYLQQSRKNARASCTTPLCVRLPTYEAAASGMCQFGQQGSPEPSTLVLGFSHSFLAIHRALQHYDTTTNRRVALLLYSHKKHGSFLYPAVCYIYQPV